MTVANSTPAKLIQAVEQADSPQRLVTAVQTLAQARIEAAIPTLIAVLGYNNPEAAIAALNGLIELGDIAVSPLLAQIDDYNYGARAYSFRALATIAHPQAFAVLLQAAANDFAPSVRRAAAKGLGQLRWTQLPAEERHLAQQQALTTLLLLSQDPEWAIQYAAIVGLQGLAAPTTAAQPELIQQVRQRLEQMLQSESDLAIQARASEALQQLTAV